MVDHGAFADQAAEPQITLDQRRQGRERGAGVELRHRRVGIDGRRQHVHVDKTPSQGAGAQRRRREVVVMQIGERHRVRPRIGARQAGAAKHQRDVMMEDVGGDAAPEQLHRRPGAVGGFDAGPAKLEDFARMGDQRRDVVFGRGIEAAVAHRGRPAHQPIGANNRLGSGAVL